MLLEQGLGIQAAAFVGFGILCWIGVIFTERAMTVEDHPLKISINQLMLVVVWVMSVLALAACKVRDYTTSESQAYSSVSTTEGDAELGQPAEIGDAELGQPAEIGDAELGQPAEITSPAKEKKEKPEETLVYSLIKNFAKFGTVMMFYIYSAANEPLAADRVFSPDLFGGLMLLILLASLLTLQKSDKRNAGIVLNRDQTEEWKGWMQIIFLSYHYYSAGTRIYNLVRVLIAAYVWMTGYGHFCYFFYLKRPNRFGLTRVIRTVLRLNFLVFFTCLATNNTYMLYYICPMHTFWFLMVYGIMRVYASKNNDPRVMIAKFVISFILITVLFELQTVFTVVFWPTQPLLSYKGEMHEWFFRCGLDHYASWLGMLCGYVLPHYQSMLKTLEAKGGVQEWLVKGPITMVLLAATWVWHDTIFSRDKYAYNDIHPYTFFIPLLAWLWCRNLTLTLRSYHLGMFGHWGKVTLESYISQLHILLTCNAKCVIMLFPGYPIVTVIVMSIFFGICSKVLFDATVAFSMLLAPDIAETAKKKGLDAPPNDQIARENNMLLLRNAINVVIGFAGVYCVAAILHVGVASP